MNFLKTTLLSLLATASVMAQQNSWDSAAVNIVGFDGDRSLARAYINYYNQDKGVLEGITSPFGAFEELLNDIDKHNCLFLRINLPLDSINSVDSYCKAMHCLEAVKQMQDKSLKTLTFFGEDIFKDAQTALQKHFIKEAHKSKLFSQILPSFCDGNATPCNRIADIFLAVTAQNPVPHDHQAVLDEMLGLLHDSFEYASLIAKIHALKHAYNKIMSQKSCDSDMQQYKACLLDCLQWVEDHKYELESTRQDAVSQRIAELRTRFA